MLASHEDATDFVILPVAPHVSPLEFAASERYLTGITGVGVGLSCIRNSGRLISSGR